MGQATTDLVRLPPAPPIPKIAAGLGFIGARAKVVGTLAKRYGTAFTLNLPIFGKAVVISDPVLIKDLFTTSTELVGRASNLGVILGPGDRKSTRLHSSHHFI